MLHPGFAVSSDGGVLARRADVDLTTPFAGGALRSGLTSGTERIDRESPTLARQLESARFAYATASRRYRTFVDLATSRVVVAEDGGTRAEYASAYSEGGFRVERPGLVTLDAGARATRQSADYGRYLPPAYTLQGAASALTTFLEAHAGNDRMRVDAGLGSALVASQATFAIGQFAATQRALLPALTLRAGIGGGFYARTGFSESLRLPTLLESAAYASSTLPLQLERGELLDAALGFDAGGRLRGEAIAYREFTRGGAVRRLDGVGASLVWQIAPLVSLRAWSLRTEPLNLITAAYAAALPASRQVLWATFERRDLLRVDMIVHRDRASDSRAAIALDGDVLVPAGPHVALDFTTSRRDGVRRFGVGLRAR